MPVLPDNPYWVSCDELFEDQGVVYEYGRQRNYTRKHLVIVKEKALGPVAVGLCPALPKPGSVYVHSGDLTPSIPIEYDLVAIMTRQSAARKSNDGGDWPHWIVTSEYSTNIQSRQDIPSIGNNANKPEEDLAEIDWDYETAHEAKQFDLDGNPFLNRARQPFSPPFTTEVDYPVLTISRNELNFDYNKASMYARSLNDSTFLGAPPGCVQILPPKSKQKNIGRIRYWRTTYRLRFRAKQRNNGYTIPLTQQWIAGLKTGGGYMEYKLNPITDEYEWTMFPAPINMPDSWQPTLLNAGAYKLGRAGEVEPAAVNKPIPIFRHGHQIQHPVPLGPNGEVLELPADPNEAMTCWYIRFHTYRYVSIVDLLVNGLS